ncbi:aldose 1-epimerase [Morchella conica CCBAS932]|uniref:Aldose 1-epimerase n=1 Tax=Morchella conica CCBAS932 TaxID=1392247 RepID=A0A3N4L3X5_9PEZI|nr:aldose 1-epimerase [Morchella conica CCBAS932]
MRRTLQKLTMSPPSVKFINRGAILQEFIVGPENRNIVLGFNTAAEYHNNPAHFGATIGRVANRLKNAELSSLNGTVWPLTANDGPNTLHGGPVGWGLKDWTGPGLASKGVDRETVVYKYLSPHMDENFPGTVEVEVAYTAYEEPSEEEGVRVTVLEMDYEAKLVGDEVEETAINMTNHSYFNLSGSETIADTRAILTTTDHLPLDSTGIPVSTAITPYPGLTANQAFTLGPTEPDVDDCFILNTDPSSIPTDTRSQPLKTCARFYHPTSKIHLDVLSTDPAFQFYTGKYIDVKAREDGSPARVSRAGFCVEPSRYVNAANVEEWKGMTVIKKGQVYGSKIVYRAWHGGKEEF